MTINSFNQALTEVSKKVLDYGKKRKKDCIKLDTWKIIDRRRKVKKKALEAKSQRLKEKLQTTYSELDREVKKRTIGDKKAFMEKLAEEVEEAAQKQDMGTLYKITKSLAGGFKNNDVPVKDSDGNVITGIVEQMQRWKNQRVLNREATSIHANIPDNDSGLDVDTNPPSLDEVKNAIRHLKSRKAPGTDCINAEMLKAGGVVTANALTKEIWETEVIPNVWKTALIVKLPKKGTLVSVMERNRLTIHYE